MLSWLSNRGGNAIRILRKGRAQRVLFYLDGDNGSTMDDVNVTLYENGIVMIESKNEESTTDIRNVEIFWRIGPSERDNTDQQSNGGTGRVLHLRPEVTR